MGNAESEPLTVDASPSVVWADRFEASTKIGKLKILALHGHGSNTDITKMQIANLRLDTRLDNHDVACDFFQGEYLTEAQNSTLPMFSDGPFRTWVDRDTMEPSLDRTIREIFEVIETHGPYDGIYGFSLGGMVATVLSSPVVWGRMMGYERPPWRFVIIACAGGLSWVNSLTVPVIAAPSESVGTASSGGGGGGTLTRSSSSTASLSSFFGSDDEGLGLAPHVREPVFAPDPALPGCACCDVPSLHVVGRRDPGRAGSEACCALYSTSTATTLEVDCAHEIPTLLRKDAVLREAVGKFLSRQHGGTYFSRCSPSPDGSKSGLARATEEPAVVSKSVKGAPFSAQERQ